LRACRRLHANLRDALRLVNFAAERGAGAAIPVAEIVHALAAWLAIARGPTSPSSDDGTPAAEPDDTSMLIAAALSHIIAFLTASPTGSANTDGDGAAAAMQLLADLLANQRPLVSHAHLAAIRAFLAGPPGEAYATRLLAGDYADDTMQFLELLVAYARLDCARLLAGEEAGEQADADAQVDSRIVLLLHTLFRAPGFPEVDEKVSTLLVELWTNAADDLSDQLMAGERDTVPARFKAELATAIQTAYPKLCFPSSGPGPLGSSGSAADPPDWDDADRRAFCGFRRDFADFLLIAHSLLGAALVQELHS
ncbi:hypothetical protein KEM52_004500, partial [Ascosphaera acerosa]